MKNIKYYIAAALGLMGLLGASVAFANPFYNGTLAQTAAATSTVTYMTPGTATTTPVYDSYEQYGTNQTNAGNLTLPDTVAILMQGVASSTLTTVNVACEYSNNYNAVTGNGDWYQNEMLSSTSTGPLSIGTPVSYAMVFASSTVGGAAGTNSDRFEKIFTCPVPVRFVRAVITMTGARGSVWAAIVPVKQRN